MYHPPRMTFALHPTLARDTVEVARFPLCRVLLMNDRRFPWLILVPEREGAREIHELAAEDRAAADQGAGDQGAGDQAAPDQAAPAQGAGSVPTMEAER